MTSGAATSDSAGAVPIRYHPTFYLLLRSKSYVKRKWASITLSSIFFLQESLTKLGNGQKGEEESRSIAQELETKRHDVRIDGESDI